jgi:hypothetical protein
VITPPVITPPVITPPPTTIIAPPAGLGAKIESVTPITSQLMSSLTAPANAIRPVAPTAAAFHSAMVGGSTTATTVSLATEAVTTPVAQTGAASVKTPAVLAPSSKSGGIKAIGTGLRNVAGGTSSHGH